MEPRDRVFISYAHVDKYWLDRLTSAFANDLRAHLVDVWDDRLIESGHDWHDKIDRAIDRARVAVLLVSPAFLKSTFIMNEELPRILEAVNHGLTILWIPLEGPFSGPGALPGAERITKYQAICDPKTPLIARPGRGQSGTLIDVAVRIDRLLGRVRVPRNLPFASIGSLFKGREKDLADLERHLAQHGAAAITQAEAITGMGGIGKTRLALEYAWRHDGAFSAFLFVSAPTPADLKTNFARLSAPEALDLKESQAATQPEQFSAVLHWLQTNPGWLLMLDAADTVDAANAVMQLTPKLHGGQVLITSRISHWEGSVQPLGIHVLDEKPAVAYLMDRTASNRQPHGDDEAQAKAIAADLGRLALALEQAAAYINARSCSFAAYRERWQPARDRLLQFHDPLATHYEKSVAATWLTTFEQLSDNGRRLLNILAWFAPEPIPRSLLSVDGGPFAAESESGAAEEQWPLLVEDAEEALADLKTFSLITWNEEKTAFEIHALVQEVTRHNLTEDEQKGFVATALRWVNGGFVGNPQDVRDWPTLLPLLAHVKQAANEAAALGIHDPTGRLLNVAGLLLNERAQWAESEALQRRALATAEAADPPDETLIAVCLNDLALVLHSTNRTAEAEPLYRRALEIDERRFGPEDIRIAIRLNNLAGLLQATSSTAEAERLFRRALAIDEESLGPDHPHVAIRLHNLSGLLLDVNRPAEAEPLVRRALAIDEKSYGPRHPSVARDLNNLAQLLQATNRSAEAEPLFRRALAIDEESLGPDHPTVAIRLDNLAQLLQATNRLAEAEPLYRRALAIDEKSYGPDHPNVATALKNLASLLYSTGRLSEAEPPMRRALAIIEESLGPDHPKVAGNLTSLAVLLEATNSLAEVEQLYRRSLAIDEKSYGPHHSVVARDLNNLALLLYQMKRLDEAEALFRRALAIDEKNYGPDHPNATSILNNLASLLKAVYRTHEAEALFRRALAVDERSYGPNHPKVAKRLNNLAALLNESNRSAEAEPLARRAVEIRLKALAPDHPHTRGSLESLARILEAQGKHDKAAELRRRHHL